MRTVLAVLLAVVWTGLAHAEPAPHVVKYRAFQAALEAGDIAAADKAGAEALQVADANGASAATVQALAVNLAGLRLSYGRPDPQAPLARAEALASAGATAASPESLKLLSAWATMDAKRASHLRLRDAIARSPDVDIGWRWSAAQALAQAATKARDWALLEEAGALAVDLADGANFPAAAARGQALTLRAIGTFRSRRATVASLSRLEDETAGEVKRAFAYASEATDLLAPFRAPGLNGDVTLGVRLYGQAVAWRAVIGSMLRTLDVDNREAPPAPPAPAIKSPEVTYTSRNLCEYERVTPDVRFPSGAEDSGTVGGVSTLVRFNAEGVVDDVKILAEVPAANFSDAVRAAMIGLKASRKADNKPGCEPSYWMYFTFTFMFGFE